MDFFQHQERARRKTGLLVLYFILAVAAVVLCVNLALLLAFVWMDVQLVPPSQWFSHPLTLWITLFTLLVMVCGCLMRRAVRLPIFAPAPEPMGMAGAMWHV